MKNRRSNRGQSLHWSGANEHALARHTNKRDRTLLQLKSKFEASDMKEFIKKLGHLLSTNDLRFYGSLWQQAAAGKALTQKQRFFKTKIEKKAAAAAETINVQSKEHPTKKNVDRVVLRKKGSRSE